MTNQKSTIEVQLVASQHLDLAAFHLYEACREWSKVDLPPFDDDDVAEMRRDAKYRAMAAHKRGIQSCRAICRERIASALARADGYSWPECNRGTGAAPAPARARIRQRFRHVAGLVMGETFAYLEHATDTEEQRQIIVADLQRQRTEDAILVSEWRATVGLPPSTVTQIAKDSER